MRYDVQIPQSNGEKLEAEIVSDKNQYAILSVDGQKVSLPFEVIDILHHEAEVVRYGDYVREMWAEDYEGELSDEKIREISGSMLDYLTQCGDEYEIEELNAKLEEANEELEELDNLNKAKQVWDELTDVPMDPETECIESDWKQFPAGTHREEIWHWIEDTYNVSVAEDLMFYEEPER